MSFDLIIKGIIIGISVSAPLGPIGVLCIQKTLNKGMWAGFISGIGAAAADTLFAAIAGFGLTFISDFLSSHQLYLRIIGGLCYPCNPRPKSLFAPGHAAVSRAWWVIHELHE